MSWCVYININSVFDIDEIMHGWLCDHEIVSWNDLTTFLRHIRNSFNSLNPNSPTPLSVTIIKYKDIAATENTVEKKLNLIDPATGNPGGQIIIDVQLNTLAEALSHEEHTVYQYQRFQPSKIQS